MEFLAFLYTVLLVAICLMMALLLYRSAKPAANRDDAERKEWLRQQLEAQSQRADFDDLRIVAAEHGDNLAGKQQRNHAEHDENNGHDLHAEPKGLAHALILACAVGEAADRLEALAEADDGRIDEHRVAADDGHGRNRRVAVHARRVVEQDGGDARDALAAERGNAVIADAAVDLQAGLEV